VTNVLEGSVRRAGNRIRITAQLTQVADGFSLWSDSFDEDAADVFKAQDELSRRIASALHEKLAVAQSGTVTTERGTKDLEAYDLYLRGRYFWQHRGEVGLRRAAFLFSSAIQRDSTFARAWAGLALVQVVLPEYETRPTDTLYTAGLKNAAHAITLDSNLGDGHLALAYGLIARWELDSSEASFRRALALSPNDPSVHQWYGDMLQSSGRMKESLDQLHTAQRLDPTSAVLTNELAYIYANLRNFDEALRWHRKGVELDSTFAINFSNAALSYGYLHQPDSALAVLKRSEKLLGGSLIPSGRAIRVVALAVSGRTADARKEAAVLDDEAAHGLIPAFNAATAYAALGDREAALKWLTKSVDAHETDPLVQAVVCFPPFDFLNGDPRYTALLARMHLKRCIRT
jgi:serine/threonine-protein kinase